MQADLTAGRAMAAGAAQKQEEFVQLVALVAEAQPKTVLEIGTMKGGTLLAWCEVADDGALIVSVDLPNGRWGGGYEPHEVDRLESLARERQELVLIRGDSHDPAIREKVGGLLPSIDFLFIDGDHTYPGARQDYEDFSPLVKPGGLIAFHDILPHPQVPECDVDQLWAEIKGGDFEETWEFTVDGDERGYGPWGGIGVLRVPS